MSDKEKRWRRIYKWAKIFVYGIYLPVETLEWLFMDERFPFSAIAISGALPFIIQNHLKQIQAQENITKIGEK
jgi:hypothetical protein